MKNIVFQVERLYNVGAYCTNVSVKQRKEIRIAETIRIIFACSLAGGSYLVFYKQHPSWQTFFVY